jgi:hypothetical protein
VVIDRPRRCLGCGALLASTSRSDRKFCGVACRVADHRRRHAGPSPAELAGLADELPAAVAESTLVAGLRDAARLDWKAAAWLLERRWPQRWAPAERTVGTSVDRDAQDCGPTRSM